MPRFPTATSKDVTRVAVKLGFEYSRQAGTSHAIYKRKSDRRRVVIPVHPSRDIKRKTLAAIISDFGITVDEFRGALVCFRFCMFPRTNAVFELFHGLTLFIKRFHRKFKNAARYCSGVFRLSQLQNYVRSEVERNWSEARRRCNIPAGVFAEHVEDDFAPTTHLLTIAADRSRTGILQLPRLYSRIPVTACFQGRVIIQNERLRDNRNHPHRMAEAITRLVT